MPDTPVDKKIKKFVLENGSAVYINEEEKKRWPDNPEFHVSIYGWDNTTVTQHGQKCGWVADEHSEIKEVTYSMFEGTFSDNSDEYGLNLTGVRCTCGKFTDVTLRYKGTMFEILQTILSY